MKTDHHLDRILQSVHTNRLAETGVLKEYKSLRTEIMEYLKQELRGDYLAGSPKTAGSFEKKTAVNNYFDLDLIVPFRHDAFGNRSDANKLREMRKLLQKVLEQKFSRYGYLVRSQKVSTGIRKQNWNREILVDVVPGLEKSPGHYQDGPDRERKFLYLLNRGDGEPLLTNVHKQIEAVKKLGDWRKVVLLLKLWKQHHHKGLSSYAVEVLVKGAAGKRKPGKTTEMLIHTLEWLSANLPRYQIVDMGTGQVWKECLSPGERQNLAGRFRNVIPIIESGSEKDLFKLFPPNRRFLKS